MTSVNIALGSLPVSDCVAADVNGDNAVEINELIASVNNALNGITVSPTPSQTPPTATAESTRSATATLAEATATATAVPATATNSATHSPTETVAVPTPTATNTRTRTPGTPSRTPTASPTYSIEEGADVVRAAAEVWVQNPESLQVADLACVSIGCDAASGASPFRLGVAPRTGMRTGAGGGRRGAPQTCSGGGTRMETCDASVHTIVFTNCVEPGPMGSTNERNGTATFTVADPNFCDDLVVDPLRSAALELHGYRHIERNAQSVEVARLEADWLDTLLPIGLGCALAAAPAPLVDAFQEVRGTMHFECRAGSMALPCPRGSTNLTVNTAGLEMLRESGGSPCELRITLTGTLGVDDRDGNLNGQSCRTQFTQTFNDYLLAEAPAGDGTSGIRQTGRLAVDRFGPLDVITRRRLDEATPAPTPDESASVRFVDGADCPDGGDAEIEVRRPAVGLQASAPSGQAICLSNLPPGVLQRGESELGSLDAATFRFQQSPAGDPQVVFDFPACDPPGEQTVTGCIGISPLTICQ